jgi:hypothetical protein
LLPLATYPAGATLGNGQLGLHVLAALVGGLMMLWRQAPSWRRDLVAAGLVLVAMVKPSIAAPFFWLVVTLGGVRPATLVLGGYLALTAFAVSFQAADPLDMLREWATLSAREASRGGTADLHVWLHAAGLADWIGPASLIALGLVGAWARRHRHADPWLQLGVVALAARLWVHHRWYDDLLVLMPLVALLRLGHAGAAGTWPWLALGTLTLLAPGGQYLVPPPWAGRFVVLQTCVWLGVLWRLHVAAREAGRPDLS